MCSNFLSDHRFVKICINCSKKGPEIRMVNSRNLKEIDHESMAQKLKGLKLDANSTPTEQILQLERGFEDILDSFAPLTKKLIKMKNPKPWYNDD